MSRSLRFPRKLSLLILILFGAPAAAEEAALAIAESPSFTQVREDGCLPSSISPETPIFAFGAYNGETHALVQIGKADRQAFRTPISGSAEGPKAVLLLMANEPILWDFTEAPHERIAAVILSGYHDQAALNLPLEIPVRFSSRSGESDSPACHGIGYAHKGGMDLERAVLKVEALTGLTVESFGGTHRPKALRMTEARLVQAMKPQELAASGVIRALVAVTEAKRMLAMAGLTRLLAEGKIRHAARQDIDLWRRAAAERLKKADSEVVYGPAAHRSYVALQPFLVPHGMYGAHAKNFIIPPGVPKPDDAGSHNTYYFIEDGRRCSGATGDCARLPQTASPSGETASPSEEEPVWEVLK